MIELDDRLSALRALGTEWAGQLRAAALDLDRDPSAIAGFLTEPVVRFLATARYASTDDAEPIQADRYRYFAGTALEQAVLFEELARGDLGAIMASPGAPMAGAIVQLLGDENQRRGFFGRLDEQPTWTFLALSEPGQGSDAANMATSLTQDGDRFLLTGAKRYVGNATRAGPGVVFARTGPGPLGVRAVLVPAPSAGFTATALSTLGLRAALLAAIEMDAVEIAPEWLLGRHLSSTRRGIWSWVQTFNRIRPRVAAMGLGLARAAYDYVVTELPAPRARDADRLAELGLRIDAVRQLIWHAAAAVDADPANGHLPSAAKAQAARLAEDATLTATELLGPAARLEHPLLDKLVRDARGVEFMEGAGHLQRLGIAQQLTRQRSRALYHNDIGFSSQAIRMAPCGDQEGKEKAFIITRTTAVMIKAF